MLAPSRCDGWLLACSDRPERRSERSDARCPPVRCSPLTSEPPRRSESASRFVRSHCSQGRLAKRDAGDHPNRNRFHDRPTVPVTFVTMRVACWDHDEGGPLSPALSNRARCLARNVRQLLVHLRRRGGLPWRRPWTVRPNCRNARPLGRSLCRGRYSPSWRARWRPLCTRSVRKLARVALA